MNIEIILVTLAALNAAGVGYLVWTQTVGMSSRFKHQMVVDTSGLIDGRIIDIVRSGFVPQRLIVPQFVVAELQFLADQGDALKRERARFGLEVVRRLQDMRQTEVVISPGRVRGEKAVDDKLVALAKKHSALLYTTDFNLNQVAQIEGVRVLNVNELAQGVRATYLPGEKTEIKITQAGQDRNQGVGYLEDGTMVVVEQAGKQIGNKVAVEFSRMLQTQAGKMMFATIADYHRKSNQQPVQSKQAKQQDSAKSQPKQAAQLPGQAAKKAAVAMQAAATAAPGHGQQAQPPKNQAAPAQIVTEQAPAKQKTGKQYYRHRRPQQNKANGGQQAAA